MELTPFEQWMLKNTGYVVRGVSKYQRCESCGEHLVSSPATDAEIKMTHLLCGSYLAMDLQDKLNARRRRFGAIMGLRAQLMRNEAINALKKAVELYGDNAEVKVIEEPLKDTIYVVSSDHMLPFPIDGRGASWDEAFANLAQKIEADEKQFATRVDQVVGKRAA